MDVTHKNLIEKTATVQKIKINTEIVKTPTPTQHNTTVGFDMKMTVHNLISLT